MNSYKIQFPFFLEHRNMAAKRHPVHSSSSCTFLSLVRRQRSVGHIACWRWLYTDATAYKTVDFHRSRQALPNFVYSVINKSRLLLLISCCYIKVCYDRNDKRDNVPTRCWNNVLYTCTMFQALPAKGAGRGIGVRPCYWSLHILCVLIWK